MARRPRLAVGGVAGLEEVLDDAHELERALPVRREVAHVHARHVLGRHALVVHLLHQRREAVGEVVARAPRRDVGLALDQAADELGHLQAPPERGCCRRQADERRVRGDVAHDADPRQQARATGGQRLAQPALEPASVDDHRDARERLGRAGAVSLQQPEGEAFGEVRAAGQGVQMGPRHRLGHRLPLIAPPARASPRRAPRPRACRRRTTSPPRRARAARPAPPWRPRRG